VGDHCLIIQLARVGGGGAVPRILRRFLADARVTFAGYEHEQQQCQDDDDDDDESEAECYSSDDASEPEHEQQQCGWGRFVVGLLERVGGGGGQREDWEVDDRVYDSMCSVAY
jgi:hypothetical protein